MRELWQLRIAPFIEDEDRRVVLIVILLLILFSGWAMGWGRIGRGLRAIITHPSPLLSDYVAVAGSGPAMVNAALVGLIGLGLLTIFKADITGPSTAAIFTMTGFGLFGKNVFNILPIFVGVWLYSRYEGASFGPTLINLGKHPRNIWPLMLGAWLATFVFHWPVTSASALLAALFATTMAPISMQFGWHVGVVAGFLHQAVVNSVGVVHGGMNLYNNGFSGGLIATVIVAVIRG